MFPAIYSINLPILSKSLRNSCTIKAAETLDLNPGHNRTMRIEGMTIGELIAEYNRCGPVEPLERWDGSRDELVEMLRIAKKQSNPNGIVSGISVSVARDR